MAHHLLKKITCLLSIVWPLWSSAQSLPVNLTYEANSHLLTRECEEISDFYRLTEVDTIYLTFSDPDYWNTLQENYITDDYLIASFRCKDYVFDSVGVQFKGNTSYKRPIEEGSEKLSFNIDLNYYIEGQDIEGYNTLNLNNAYGDATFMKEVLYAHLAQAFIPAPRANFVRLFINEQDWGIYPNLQQVNGDLIKEWFMNDNGARWRANGTSTSSKSAVVLPLEAAGNQWGDGTAALNYHGDDTSIYKEYYTLKDSELEHPWDYLVSLCDVLNNTPLEQLKDSLEKVMDIDAVLWHLATETLFADDDSYVYKGKMDYGLYYDEYTERFYLLEIDGNSSLSIKNATWDLFYNEDNINYPLMNRLFQVPELRQRYLAHARTMIEEAFDTEKTDLLIDSISAIIADQVKSDPKKTSTNTAFNNQIRMLKNFFVRRKAVIESHSEYAVASPEINEVYYATNGEKWLSPQADEVVKIYAQLDNPQDVQALKLYYSSGYLGAFTQVPMFLDDGMFTAELSGFDAGEYVRFYIEAIANDSVGTRKYAPQGAEHNTYLFRVAVADVLASGLVINELMASNDDVIADSNGEYDDWIELYNGTDAPISLEGYHLSDKADNLYKWSFPSTSVIEADDLHANFKLSADGEELFLSNASGELIDEVYFTSQRSNTSYGRSPNGIGDFNFLEPTPEANNDEMASGLNESINSTATCTIYPNPAEHILHLKGIETSAAQVYIYALSGELIKMVDAEEEINVSSLKPGVYILKCEQYVGRFIKQ